MLLRLNNDFLKEKFVKRQLLDDDMPNGYMISDNEHMSNNHELIMNLLEMVEFGMKEIS